MSVERTIGRDERIMERSDRMNRAWARFLETRAGVWIKERTPWVRMLASGGEHATRALLAGCLLPPGLLMLMALFTQAWPMFLLALVLAAVLLVVLTRFWLSYRDSPQQDRDRLDTNPGLLSRSGALHRLSGWKLSKDADHALKQQRASLDADPATRGARISPRSLGVQLGHCHGVDVWLSSERPVYALASTRQGKTTRLVIPCIMEAPGAVVATSSRRDIVDATLQLRHDGFDTQGRSDYAGGRPGMEGGPVHVFDPTGILGGDPRYDAYRIHWDPVWRCIDPKVARSTASSMVGAADLSAENQIWAHIGVEITQGLLLAGAVKGVGLDTVWEWSQGMKGVNTACSILEQHADPAIRDLALPLKQLAQESDPRTRSSKMLSVTAAFGALSVPAVREWFKPRPGPRFDMASFLASKGTVYMLAPLRNTAGEAEASVSVFSGMFLQEARDEARRLASASEYGKLEPPVTLVLDEVANIAPWEGLPQLDTAGTGDGIWPIQIFQSADQAMAAFSREEEKQMWDNSQKVILGGSSGTDTLQAISSLTGENRRSYREHSWQGMSALSANQSTMERQETKPSLSPDDIRRIPTDRALLINGNDPAAAVKLIPYWERGWKPRSRTTTARSALA